MTSNREGEDDEDIITSNTTTPIEVQGPIMRSRAQQLHHQEWIMEDMWDIKKVLEIQGNTHNKVEVQAISKSRSLTSSPTQSPGPPCLQIDVPDVSNL
jgi:hypothetical protein